MTTATTHTPVQEDKTAVAAALIDSLLCGEDVNPLMEGFLKGFFVRHQLDYDVTLARYILDTLAASDHDWWAWQEAPWENKLYAIIDVMSDVEVLCFVLPVICVLFIMAKIEVMSDL